MRTILISFTTTLIFSILMIGCGGGTTDTANTAANTSNAANTTANTNNPLETTKKPEAATTNNAPTIAPVVQAYYDGLKKKDDAAVRNVLSKPLLADIESDMKAEKKTKMAEFIAETEIVPDKPVEVRNETINGDKAVAEVKGGTYVNWTKLAFVKEGGAWKFSNESPETEGMKQSNK
ncbi:MAG TPA: hypothetical protein VL325_09420 [Pyrinomonadaceae bacterium]|nr:hypothetical protein [Pyrinomonadaceae bacterium]